MNALRRHARRFVRHLWWIFLAVTGLFATRAVVPEAVLRSAAEGSGNFLQAFGSIYGVIVAFILYMVWQQHNDTQVAVEREAVTLGELFRTLGWFTSWPERDEVRRRLRAYSRVVPMLNGAKPETPEEDDKRLLDHSLNAFLGYVPLPHEERLYAPAFDLFHDLNQVREHRLTVSRLHLPEGLRWFVFLGGAICVASVWLLWMERVDVQALLTACMTWVIVAVAALILDLDDPYSGDFVVDWGRFNEAAARMDALQCPSMEPRA